MAAKLASAPALALDLTAGWWDHAAERVSLIQIAFREGGGLRVAVVDERSGFDPGPLELGAVTKALHNAAYDAPRL